MRTPLSLILLLLLVGTALPVSLYLAVLTAVAPFGLLRKARPATRLRRFAILVPAHDEERVLGRLLDSLRALDYPSGLYDVCVVADNCTDATAAIARAGGALVFERFDRDRRAKGHALAWLIAALQEQDAEHDAFVVVDADSVLSANFLTAMNERLDAGAAIAQAYYGVLNLRGSRAESLREAALALVHFLRPAAKMALGASCGLKGNGMCFDRAVIQQFGWPATGLAEDVEFHMTLVQAGLRVQFVPEAEVRAEMPPSLQSAETQNLRWEAGRLSVARRQALPLLRDGLKMRSIGRVDAGLEQLMPPLSVPVFFATAVLAAGAAMAAPALWLSAGALLAIVALYVLAGLLLARVSPRVWAVLLLAPWYTVWKTLLYVRALTRPPRARWVRTPHGQ